ncbi:Esterase FrsA [Candidatus Lokiarchaeum ossiferum]|uniref:Esterase FrsA n=1 Tax=Candidatus Lokiarchaeum ossiferum TaxID=2951803 RepID=A0ABY6HMV1_9ARCH|nr:Esterase FrsA [Candidatus Lokiarchaeum sp. B-35]
MPEKWQKKITVKLISSGKIFTTPIWKMLFQTLSFYGGDEMKIRRALIQEHEDIESIVCKLDQLAKETLQTANKENDNSSIASQNNPETLYLEAALYYAVTFFFISDEKRTRQIFAKASVCFDKFRSITTPQVQKWEFPYRNGKFFAHTYIPNGEGPFGVIIMYPGNEGIKEHMATYATYAKARNLATIAIDPPGWGESGFSGCKFTELEDYKKCTLQILEKIKHHPKLDYNHVGSFGVSGGSLTSIIVAGFLNQIQAAAGIGAPDYKTMVNVWKNALAEQKRQTYTWTGLTKKKDAIKFLQKYAEDTDPLLDHVSCPVLLIHGENDYITKAIKGKDITDRIGSHATHRIIPNDDHLCSNSIGKGLADEIFDWFAKKLV